MTYVTEREADTGPRAVEVRGKDVQVERVADVGVYEAHRRYGGLDIAATLAGTAAALGTTVLVAGVLTGAGSVGYQLGLQDGDASRWAGSSAACSPCWWGSWLAAGWPGGWPATTGGATAS